MLIDRSAIRRIFTACLLAGLLVPVTASAADIEQGRREAAVVLDGMLNSQFRRLSRVRAALYECDLDDAAAGLVPSAAEAASGAFEYSKAILNTDSADVKAWLESIAPGEAKRKVLDAVYALALETYFSGVRDGASGSLIWVDDDDKKKLCNYMIREAEDFEKLRSGE